MKWTLLGVQSLVLGLQLFGVISWPWLWVFSPLWLTVLGVLLWTFAACWAEVSRW